MPLLHWLTRDKDIHEATRTPYRLLEQVATHSHGAADTGNMLIQGDNLAALKELDHQANIAKVQEWLGHANIATIRIYDHRKTRPEDSPTFKVAYWPLPSAASEGLEPDSPRVNLFSCER